MSSTGEPHSFAPCAPAAGGSANTEVATACRNARRSTFFMSYSSIRNRLCRVDTQPRDGAEQEQYTREIQRRVRVDESLRDERDDNRAEDGAHLSGRVHRAAQCAGPPTADIDARAPRRTKQEVRRSASERNQHSGYDRRSRERRRNREQARRGQRSAAHDDAAETQAELSGGNVCRGTACQV